MSQCTKLMVPSRTSLPTPFEPIGRAAVCPASSNLLTLSSPVAKTCLLRIFLLSCAPSNSEIPAGAVPDVSLSYAYDVQGRLETVTDNLLASPNVTRYRYDDVGNLDYSLYPGSDAAQPGRLKHKFGYDHRNRLRKLAMGMAITGSADVPKRVYDYAVDATGAWTKVQETVAGGTNRQVDYRYDEGSPTPARVHRLTSEIITRGANPSTVSHGYDVVGNRLTRTAETNLFIAPPSGETQDFGYNALDQITTATYDANGNELLEPAENTGDAKVYDAENRLINRGSSLEFGYDHNGNRVWKRAGNLTTFYLVDELNPTGYAQVLAEYTASLVGCWNFDEGSGTTSADVSTNGNSATLGSSVT